jgi:hypothetical protein
MSLMWRSRCSLDELICGGRHRPGCRQGLGEEVLMMLPKAITARDRQCKFPIASEQDKNQAEGHLSLN